MIGYMRRFLLVAGVLLVSVSSAAESQQLPVVPSPQGFVEASALSPTIRRNALAGHLPSEKLIGIYYQPDALAEILRDGTTAPSPIYTAYVQREFESVSAADTYFRELVQNAKKDEKQKFDRNDPAIDRILNNYEKAAKGLGNGTTITVNGATTLGELSEGSNFYSGSLISAYQWSNGTQSAVMTFASAVAWMRLGTRVIKLSATYPFIGKQSIIEANGALLNWVSQVTTAN
jgi:hypothetical protein